MICGKFDITFTFILYQLTSNNLNIRNRPTLWFLIQESVVATIRSSLAHHFQASFPVFFFMAPEVKSENQFNFTCAVLFDSKLGIVEN